MGPSPWLPPSRPQLLKCPLLPIVPWAGEQVFNTGILIIHPGQSRHHAKAGPEDSEPDGTDRTNGKTVRGWSYPTSQGPPLAKHNLTAGLTQCYGLCLDVPLKASCVHRVILLVAKSRVWN